MTWVQKKTDPRKNLKHINYYRFGLFFFLFITLSFSLTNISLANKNSLPLSKNEINYNLGSYIQVLKDPTNNLTIDQVSTPPKVNQFINTKSQIIKIDQPKSAYWIRFTLKATEHELCCQSDAPVYLQLGWPFIALVDLYIPQSSSGHSFRTVKGGFLRDLPEASYLEQSLVFALPDDLKSPATFYLRIKSFTPIISPLFLVTSQAFHHAAKKRTLFLGGFYGLIIGLIFFNFFLFFVLRQPAFLWFVLVAIFSAAFQLGFDGLIWEYQIESLYPFFQARMVYVWLCLLALATILLTQSLLETKRHLPLENRLLKISFWIWVVSLPLSLWGPLELISPFMDILLFLGTILLIFIGFRALSKHLRPAKLFLAANISSSLAGFYVTLNELAVVPYSFWSFKVVHIGIALDALFLSLALSQKVRKLKKEKERYKKKQDLLHSMSLTDSLTGLYNRRYLEKHLTKEVAQAKELKVPLCVLMLDVDNFKKYNDTFGHLKGDEVLITLGELIIKSIRNQDSGCRYGGEEFVVILSETSLEQAIKVAERIRTSLASFDFFPQEDIKQAVRVTVSIGVAQLQIQDNALILLKKADKALYRAKSKGKNQTQYI